MKINRSRALQSALIAGILVFSGGVVEHWRHGMACRSAKEAHAKRISSGAFELGCELGYRHSQHGQAYESLLESAHAFRQTGWFRVKPAADR